MLRGLGTRRSPSGRSARTTLTSAADLGGSNLPLDGIADSMRRWSRSCGHAGAIVRGQGDSEAPEDQEGAVAQPTTQTHDAQLVESASCAAERAQETLYG